MAIKILNFTIQIDCNRLSNNWGPIQNNILESVCLEGT